MLADLGFGLLVLTFLTSIFSIVAAILGYVKKDFRWVESARRASMLLFPLITITVFILLYLLGANHFEVKICIFGNQPEHAHVFEIDCFVGGAIRLAVVLGVVAFGLFIRSDAAQMGP